MWPFQQLEENIVPASRSEVEEQVENRSHGSRDGYGEAVSDTDSDAEADQFMPGPTQTLPNCTSIDMLLVKSLQTYAAVQRTTAVRQLRCECSEVFTVHRTNTMERRIERPLRPYFSQVILPHRRYTRPVYLSPSYSSNDDENSSSDSDSDYFRIVTDPRSSFTRSLQSSGHKSESAKFIETDDSPQPHNDPRPNPQPRRLLSYVQNMPHPNLAARQVANRVIKYARYAKNEHEEDMCCLNCGLFPVCPVTGQCGHTRCTKCIERTRKCPCGGDSQEPLCVNILIRDLIERTLKNSTAPRLTKMVATASSIALPENNLLLGVRGSSVGAARTKRRKRPYVTSHSTEQYGSNVPMSTRARFSYALELLSVGRHKDAAPHLAIAATSLQSEYRVARSLLAQVIMVLSSKYNPSDLNKELNLSVRDLSSIKWIKKNDMECVLCSDIFTKPVTTPCGHMFCRTCLEKTLDYRKRCPLCLRCLNNFNLTEVNDTVFIKGALAELDALIKPSSIEDEDLVPIFVCTVAYPSVPCPLFIFDPRYWLMIRRVLESGSRKFGMVPVDKDKKYADYGTILEVRDCVHFEDGRSILSTIGLSRFKVIERCVRDGCEVARIERIRDIQPQDLLDKEELRSCSSHVIVKTIFWLRQLSRDVLYDIENAFGRLPSTMDDEENEHSWDTSDGPDWLWWLIAVLPLRTEIKILILSTDRLLKRMRAIARTFDAMQNIKLTTISPDDCAVRV